VNSELPTLAMVQRRRDGDLYSKLIGLVNLALDDALHLRRVQGVELGPGIALLLRHLPVRQSQRAQEGSLQCFIALGLAPDTHPCPASLASGQPLQLYAEAGF